MCDSIGQNLKSLLSLCCSLNLGLHTWASALPLSYHQPDCSIFRVVWGGAPQAAGTAWLSAKKLICELVLCCRQPPPSRSWLPVLLITYHRTKWYTLWSQHSRDRGRWLSWVWGQTALHSNFQDSQGYSCLKTGGRTHYLKADPLTALRHSFPFSVHSAFQRLLSSFLKHAQES